VYTAYRFLEPTYRAMNRLGPYQATCARAAVLLHDAFKYGQQPADRSNGDDGDAPTHAYANDLLAHLPQYTVTDHDTEMVSFIESDTALPDEVAWYVASHGGSGDWYGHDGPTPSTGPEMIVHLADVFATNMEHKLPVYEPTAGLERLVGSELPTISDDEWLQ